MADEWGYKEHNGPAHWHKWFPVAENGTRQSPVAIKTDGVTPSPDLPPLKYKYDPNNCLSVTNTGASWRMDVNEEGSSLTGGPLDSEYKLLQIHAHWGGENWHDEKGSEHTIDGQAYEAELHMVHYNTKYKEAGQALDKPDGLAVLGVMIKVDDADPHPELEKLCDSLENIQLKGEKCSIQTPIDPIALLPENKSYFTYPGSLTTPPLLESVTWILFRDPITTDCKQLHTMSSLSISANEEDEDDVMTNNYRPPCPIGNRVIRFFSTDSIKESHISKEPVVLTEPNIDKDNDLTSELSNTTEPTISATFEKIDSASLSLFETIEPARGSVSPSFKIDEPESEPELSEPEESDDTSPVEADETSIPCSKMRDNEPEKGFCPYTFMVDNKTTIIATAAFAISIPIIMRCINK